MESDRRMDPALYKAATQGKVSGLRQLMEKDSTILTATTPQLNTALHLAALHGHAGFAAKVMDKIEDHLVARNDDGDTPLHLAAKAGKQEVAALLINRALALPQDQKSPLIMINKAGNTPLHEAVRHHRGAVAVALLNADPMRGYDFNEQMESPLHMAAREGLVGVVRKIVDYTFVEQEFPPSVSLSGTALHQAVLGGHIKVVEILLEKRPGLIDLIDSEGNNALHFAAQKNDRHAVEMLLNKRTELAYQRNHSNSQSALHVAAHYGSTDAIKALLLHCPDVVEMVDANGRNAFHTSVISGKVHSLKCLLSNVRYGAMNQVDNEGNTPLHLALKLGRLQACELLLGDPLLDPSVLNLEGQTARSLIESQKEVNNYMMYVWTKLKKLEYSRSTSLPSQTQEWWIEFSRYVEKRMGTYTLVATLIATVTFSALFTMPGGYDQQNGTALLGHRMAFKVFVMANTLAMLSSIVVVFNFIWPRREDDQDINTSQVAWNHWLTVFACLAMVASLTSAVYLTVEPKSPWLAYAVIALGCGTPAVMSVMLGKDVFITPA